MNSLLFQFLHGGLYIFYVRKFRRGCSVCKDYIYTTAPRLKFTRYLKFFLQGIRFTSALFFASITGTAIAASIPSYSFWYGVNPPLDLLSQFDRIVVEADNISGKELKALQQHGGKVLAYLSVCEWNTSRATSVSINPSWVIGGNPSWGTQVMDLASNGWQQFILDRAAELQKRGFEGLFLDTLDSYMALDLSVSKTEKQQQGLVQILKQLKSRHSKFVLVANRGFEVMDRIAPYLEAVAAESLYQKWDNSRQRYLPVPEDDRNWLKNKLNAIKSKHALDIVAIDYLPPEQREKAREIAKKIELDGFIPWVANPSLDYMGIGLLEAIPRRVLFLYDSKFERKNFDETNIHRLCAPIFEYMGYIPVYIDVRQDLPKEIFKGRYIGIVSWFLAPVKGSSFSAWLRQKIQETVPVALLGDVTVLKDQQLTELVGLRVGEQLSTPKVTVREQTSMIGFEAKELGRIDHVFPLFSSDQRNNKSHLRLQDKGGRQADLVVTGDWGGFAADSAVIDEDFSFYAAWILNPFTFFQEALHLPPLPAPDITTENGRRLFFIHIDGDGFMEKFETPGKGYASEMLLENIFKVYPVPHTISIIEGEIASTGLYPQISSQLESIAKKIFALDHVEIASHSYSHPFKWGKIAEGEKSGTYNLPIKGYAFELEREIKGSVDYINSRLAPINKKTAVFFWTGNCVPTPEAIAMTSDAGLLNINGGDTSINEATPSITRISGIGKQFDNGEFQTYAPVGNENIYTNLWTGPFSGYRRAIETFQLTEKPRRMKPINIYYHFYSGSKYASLNALKSAYDWAMAEETMPIYASDYIRKAINYQTVGIARRSNGSFRVTGLHDVKTLRLTKGNGWPQEKKSNGLAGWRNLGDDIYLHAGPDSVTEIVLGPEPDKSPHLLQTNGRLTKWQRNNNGKISFRIEGNVPVLMEIANADKKYVVTWKKGTISPQENGNNVLTYTFPAKDTGDAQLECDE